MRRTTRDTLPIGAASWRGPLLVGLRRLRVELRPVTAGGHGTLPGAATSRSRAPRGRATPEERLEILGFVSMAELSWIHLDRAYYLSSPEDRTQLCAVLREVLLSTDRLAVGQLVLRRRRQLVAIYAYRGALVLHTLRESSRTVDPHELGISEALGGDEARAPGPWNTARPPTAVPAATARARTGGIAPVAVGGTRVLDFTAALKRRREAESAAPCAALHPPRRRPLAIAPRSPAGTE